MGEPIPVVLVTHQGAAHVTAYLDALAAADDCGAVILVDPDGAWVEQARKRLGTKLRAVEKQVDPVLAKDGSGMVLVTMEARRAPAVIEAALEANWHVFAEKPACVRIEDFRKLVDLADRKHRFLMLALANRTNPEIAAARRLFESGALGRLYGVEAHLIADQTRLTRSEYHRSWFADRTRSGGGHLIWLGIHWLDLTMYITGQPIRRVAGFTANVGGQPVRIEDSAAVALQYRSGALGTLVSAYYLDKGYHQYIKVWGEHGWIMIRPMTDDPLRWYTSRGPEAGRVQSWKGKREPRGYTPFVRAAVRACRFDSEPPITNADSLRALETVFAIYRSAETGQAVDVPELA